MPQPKRPYGEELVTPIYVPEQQVRSLLPEVDAAIRNFVEHQYAAKLDLLLKHYGIEHAYGKEWRRLALALAIDHLDGFQLSTERPPRAYLETTKQTAAMKRKVRLFEQVERLRTSDGKTIAQAIKAIHADPSSEWHHNDERSMLTRYKEGAALARASAKINKKLEAGLAPSQSVKQETKSTKKKT